MIEFERVRLEYGPLSGAPPALDEVSFAIAGGAFVFLTGHSGAGKSSLLRLVARLERPTAGAIRVGGIDYATLAPRREPALRRQMGIVFQDNRLLGDRDVFDNVALPLVIGGYRYDDVRLRVRTALERVGLGRRARALPGTLSDGERQRVGIARAVVARPRLLLADEPTGNLDPEISADILELLLRFNASGVTVLFATHDTALLERFDFPRLTLAGGRLVDRVTGRGGRRAPRGGGERLVEPPDGRDARRAPRRGEGR